MKICAGEAVDLFYRFGFFSLSVRVVPRDDPGKWLIREPTLNVFDSNSILIKHNNSDGRFDKNMKVSMFLILQIAPYVF